MERFRPDESLEAKFRQRAAATRILDACPRQRRIEIIAAVHIPRAGVDPIAVAEIQHMIQKLRDRRMGILITDHNVRETLAITDRAYIMREGQILASGSAEELYINPLVRQYYLGDNFQV